MNHKADTMETISFWEATTPHRPEFPALSGDLEVDIAIVGGGITGITAALQLVEAGKRVAVVEARRIGGGTTGWSTGNLYVPVGPYYQHIQSSRDEETIRIIAEARNTALNYIEQQVREKSIDCHFSRRPWYFYTTSDQMENTIEKEGEALRRAGEKATEVTEVPPLRLQVRKAIKLEGQARFHPLRYVLAQAQDLAQKGGLIFEHTTVGDLKEEDDYCTLTTNRGTVRAGQVLLATHIPIGIHSVQTVAAPYRSYVVAMKLRSGQYPDAYFWENNGMHKAITTHSSHSMELDTLMIAGNHHKTGQATDQEYQHYFDELEQWAREHFDVESVQYRWSAQHYHSGDLVPYIGLSHKDNKRTYIATSYYADGLIYGTVAGLLLGRLMLGQDHPWLKAFDSTRGTNLTTAGTFIKENLNVAGQYLKDTPAGFGSADLEEVKPDEGKVLHVEGEKLAVYRDKQNQLYICSAVCTHMKCIVNFNNAEKTWDCPCHGSRFMLDGSVIEGPAIVNLERKRLDAEGKLVKDHSKHSGGQREINNPIT